MKPSRDDIATGLARPRTCPKCGRGFPRRLATGRYMCGWCNNNWSALDGWPFTVQEPDWIDMRAACKRVRERA